MNINLSGRRAIVTGSTAGIGFAIAQGMARAGAAVVINGRGEERVARALGELRTLIPGADLTGVAADLATSEGSAILATRAPDADILVNNVGTAVPKPFFDLDDDDWRSLFELNVMSAVRASRHYVPGMVTRGWGRVVFMSSEAAIAVPKEMVDYAMTKTAMLAISRGLAETVVGTGVTVNAILPGPTRSEIVSNWMDAVARDEGISRDEAEQRFLRSTNRPTLLRRFATTEEVANMVVYACSEQASATTGAALRVDGGVIRGLT